MSQRNQIIWPLLVLVTSFVALFVVTWFSSTPRQPENQVPAEPPASEPVAIPENPAPTPSASGTESVLVVTIKGPEPSLSQPAVDWSPVVVGVLDRKGDHLCLDQTFARDWQPENEPEWYSWEGRMCKGPPANMSIELRFVRR